jgi:hypothetical protein
MQEQMPLRLHVLVAAADEVQMRAGDHIQVFDEAVGVQRLDSTITQPIGCPRTLRQHEPHHLLMVAQDRQHLAATFQLQDQIEHPATVGAAIDIVAEKDEPIVGNGRDGFYQRAQGHAAAMDVANRYQSARHEAAGFRGGGK